MLRGPVMLQLPELERQHKQHVCPMQIKVIFKSGDIRQLGPNPVAAASKDHSLNEFLCQQTGSWFDRVLYLATA